jgi:hypothetical protein
MGMSTDWDIYSELVFEVQRYLWKLDVDVQYDWLAPVPFLLAGLSLPRALRLLRLLCTWIRKHDGRVGG